VIGTVDGEHITANADELLRHCPRRRHHATASTVLRKLSVYPSQNRLAKSLCEVDRIKRPDSHSI
jgi:TnpA family transposase